MLVIRETEKDDLENIRLLWADGDVMKFVGFPNGLDYSAEQMENWFSYIKSARPNTNHFSIYFNNKYCGESYYEIDAKTKAAALDIKLFAHARGQGIAYKGLKFAIEKAFDNGAKRVWTDPNPKNEKAVALYQRLGMKQMPFPEDIEDCPDNLYFELSNPND